MGKGGSEKKDQAEMLTILKNEGSTKSYADRMAPLKEYEALLDLPEYLSMEKRFAAEQPFFIKPQSDLPSQIHFRVKESGLSEVVHEVTVDVLISVS